MRVNGAQDGIDYSLSPDSLVSQRVVPAALLSSSAAFERDRIVTGAASSGQYLVVGSDDDEVVAVNKLAAADIAVDATGFDGQLATTDNTVQKVAQKVDDLTGGGGTPTAAR